MKGHDEFISEFILLLLVLALMFVALVTSKLMFD